MTTTTPTTTPKPRRRWLQFSLRTMLVTMLICSLPCGWLAYKLRQGRRQREAVEAIEKRGGSVNYKPASGGMVAWLGKLIGEDRSVNVFWVDLARSTVTDTGLKHLRGLTQLQYLQLGDTQVTNCGSNSPTLD